MTEWSPMTARELKKQRGGSGNASNGHKFPRQLEALCCHGDRNLGPIRVTLQYLPLFSPTTIHSSSFQKELTKVECPHLFGCLFPWKWEHLFYSDLDKQYPPVNNRNSKAADSKSPGAIPCTKKEEKKKICRSWII